MITPLEPSVEQDLIRRAKGGEYEATRVLLDQYSPALKAATAKSRLFLDKDESASAVNAAFVEALHRFDPSKHTRLNAVIKYTLTEEISFEKKSVEILTVPERTVTRYGLIMRKAGGDLQEALDTAPKHSMNPATFMAVHTALRGSGYLDGVDLETIESSAPEKPVDPYRQTLAQYVFAELEGDENNLSPEEVQVLSVHFGFSGFSFEKSFSQSAHELGLDVRDVKKLYASAIAKARNRISVNQ